jgi:hypothetical protein
MRPEFWLLQRLSATPLVLSTPLLAGRYFARLGRSPVIDDIDTRLYLS